ncbi:MAG: VWA domain-containing protein [Acidobacteria bacterium]|nr:VWA domain-containing protein [Acidobacteriota bacterium]
MFYPGPAAARGRANSSLLKLLNVVSVGLFVCLAGAVAARAQGLERELAATGRVEVVVRNRAGRVTVVAAPAEEGRKGVSLKAESPGRPVAEADVLTKAAGGKVEIEIAESRAARESERVDLTLRVPARSRVRVETGAGAADVSGPVGEAVVSTDTGTIRADVPTDALTYTFRWTASRPRVYSEIDLGETKEKRGGRFEVSGKLGDRKAKGESRTRLDFTTERGVVVFGVEASNVPSDLRERQLTEAARAVIRSGHQDLIEAIRRVVPRFVGEYAETLPAKGRQPSILAKAGQPDVAVRVAPQLMRLNASVTDRHGRAVAGLRAADFVVTENGEPREVVEVVTSRAPFNVVLLLDVSGSVEERLDFIRKAALSFVQTVGPQDRLAIVSFRDDVQVISDFTTDKAQLAERVKDIEAGGATALYDALAYSLVSTLRPLRGERTAVVVLSDGDDNRSFIPFSEVLEATVESGALVYPLYIPSGLIPAPGAPAPRSTLDPVRSRYLTLTSRADAEGRKLAELSGGVYYPVTRIDELQRAYDDVVAQLRTAYTLSYASAAEGPQQRRVRVRVNRDGAAVRLSPAVGSNDER